jgi:hypothetical protein
VMTSGRARDNKIIFTLTSNLLDGH